MPTERVSNIFGYNPVELAFDAIPDQEVELNTPFELDLHDFLPEGFTYTFGLKSGTSLPPNFSLNTTTGVISGTAMAYFVNAYNPILTATTQGVTTESNSVNFSLPSIALWTDADGAALWADADGAALWTGATN